MPEQYIAPTLRHGMESVLPPVLRGAFTLDAGYDRALGIPTFSADSSVPLRMWPDKTILFSQRASLGPKSEWYSVGAGVRSLVSSGAMVGFHFSHDWTRARSVSEPFLKEVGVGMEFFAQPGGLSDVSFLANVYIPVNEREAFTKDGASLVKERFPLSWDARLTILLPTLIESLDARTHMEAHGAPGTARNGAKAGLTVTSRDGLWRVAAEAGRDATSGDHYKVECAINASVDWQEIIEGKNPFSAPFKAQPPRAPRKLADALHDKAVRRYDLPTHREEMRTALSAITTGDEVRFVGGFPDLPSETLTVQTASSPWRDAGEVTADHRGFFSGSLKLPPGTHRIRLTHKPTGRMSETRTVTVPPYAE